MGYSFISDLIPNNNNMYLFPRCITNSRIDYTYTKNLYNPTFFK